MSKKANRHRKVSKHSQKRRNGDAATPPTGVAAPAVSVPKLDHSPATAPAEPFSLWIQPSAPNGPQRRIDSGPRPAKLGIGNLNVQRAKAPDVQVRLGEESPDAEDGIPSFDAKDVMRRYLEGDHAGAVEECMRTMKAFDKSSLEAVSPEARLQINEFVGTLLYLLTRPDLLLTREQTLKIMGGHHTLTNLVAISIFKSTDIHLAIISEQPRNFGKMLLLHSVRNKSRIDPRQFFNADPELASMWYATYGLSAVSPIAEHVWNNVKQHLAYVDDRLQVPDHRINGLLFQATYVDDDQARSIKMRFNADIQRQIGNRNPKLAPVRDRIAIVTGKWRHGTAVHRSLSPLVNSLRNNYRLTLIHLGKHDSSVVTEGFDEVRNITQEGRTLDCSDLHNGRFQLAFFPDVGMTSESIWLSNMRLAPIQAVGYGHPTTTAGSRIDYFIGGAEVELPEKAQEFYTERLVLIPGLAAVPVYPAYQPQFPPPVQDRIVINLPWGVAKINHPIVKRLQAIQQRVSRPIEFHFFPGSGLHRYHSVPVVLKELGAILGTGAKVYSNRAYAEYMTVLEEAHFALDSYPFGGYNTVVDSLHLGKPMVTQEGDRFYNRASSALLRRVGLEELITHSEEEYIEKAVRLATDDEYRNELSARLRNTDLRACLFDDDNTQYFCKAIDYLIENHERLQRATGRQPIFIR